MGVVFDGKGINSHTDGIVRLFRLPVRSSMIHDIHSDGRPTGSRCLSEPNLRGATPGILRGVRHPKFHCRVKNVMSLNKNA